jgi:hypothetical protein
MTDRAYFFIILLFFLLTLFSYKFCVCKKDWGFLSAGMAFTLAADFFLLVRYNHPVGVGVFCGAHIM